MELPSPMISWVNPFPSRVINRTIFFCNALESHACACCLLPAACCLLSFLYFHWLFPLSARQTSPGNLSISKSTQERVDSKGLYGRCRLHLMGSCIRSKLMQMHRQLLFEMRVCFSEWYFSSWPSRVVRDYLIIFRSSLTIICLEDGLGYAILSTF